MKATRISGEPGGPGIFAVSDGVKAWDAVVSRRDGAVVIDVELSSAFVVLSFWETHLVKMEVFRQLFAERAESVCADNRRTSISG